MFNIIKSLFQQRPSCEREFQNIMKACSAHMLELVQSVMQYQNDLPAMDVVLLDRLCVESNAVENFLDYANAQGNGYWYTYRRTVAFVKNFSQIAHTLISLQKMAKQKKLLPIETDFLADTEQQIQVTLQCFLSGCRHYIVEAQKHHIYQEIAISAQAGFSFNTSPSITLPMTRHVRHETQPSLKVIALASKFLHLADYNEIFDLYAPDKIVPPLWELVPERISTERIRSLETSFHNMQSTYDTFIYGSDISRQNPDVSVLYNHISLILNLLKIAVSAVHYYQRHVQYKERNCLLQLLDYSAGLELLDQLVVYSLSYTDRFRKAARVLCHKMLKEYAEPDIITAPVPNYRGFHVRPSTLIAKIVTHYGSDVTMKLDGVSYNAKLPMELFRANEELNAQRRRHVYMLLSQNTILQEHTGTPQTLDQKKLLARHVILDMFEKKHIVMYDMDLSMDDVENQENEGYFEFVKRVITRYMALGRIDAQIKAQVTFEGDKRVLQDIKILAQHGYGEDIYGNNIMLPAELSYLRR